MNRHSLFGSEERAGLICDATPLMSTDAVVLDTETTSLDAPTARIVQIGAVRIREGVLEYDERLELLVDPGVRIPASSTAIHGITNADVAGEAIFADAVQRLERFTGDALVIGHNIGFDLTVLKHEYGRAGLTWRRPRTLDTFMLARLSRETLADFTLEAIANWLGVPVEGRHTAIGDALTTARIFLALVPHLRTHGVHTIAEAETASCFSDVLDDHERAGWVAPVLDDTGRDRRRALARIDSFPFRYRARDVMSSPPVEIDADADIASAALLIAEQNVSSAIVRPGEGRPQTGIVTERDLMRALAAASAGEGLPRVSDIMSAPVESVPADAFVYRAIGHMRSRGFRHLGVADGSERVIGMLTNSDLLRQRSGDAILLGDEIERAPSVASMGAAWGRIPAIGRTLLNEEIDARDITAVVAEELRSMTKRAAELGEARMETEGRGKPPVSYCVLVLGSGGRGESLLSPDQDNAIVYASGAPEGGEDRWFGELGRHIADILNDAGIRYCDGGVMAKTPEWRHSAAKWRETVDHWIGRSDWEDVLNVDIFYDFQAVHGDASLAQNLRRYACSRASKSPGFLKLLAGAATQFQPPFGLFGGVRTENGRADLKKMGILPLVSGARLLALRHGHELHSTQSRIEAVRELNAYDREDLANVLGAHEVLLGEILAQQLKDIEAGIPPSNRVEIRALSKVRRRRLEWALKQVETMHSLVGDPFAFG